MRDARVERYLRDQRGEDRNRNRQRGRGSQVNYYEDMGMSTTEQGHEEFTEYKTKQAKEMAKENERLSQLQAVLDQERAKYNTSQSAINQYKSQIDEQRSALSEASKQASGSNLGNLVNESWSQFKKSNLVPVSVVSGRDNKTEGTYYVTLDDARALANAGFTYNQDKSGRFYFHTNIQGRVRGQELHDGLLGAQKSYETEYKTAAQRKIASEMAGAQGQIAAAQGDVSRAQSAYNNEKGNLIEWQGNINRAAQSVSLQRQELAKFAAQEQKFLVDLGSKYDKKIDAMRRISMGISVEEGTAETEGGALSGEPTLTEQIVSGENVPVVEAGPAEEVNNG